MIKTALISVWDKNGLDELVIFLTENNIEIISTGGTQKYIESLGINVTPVSTITGQDAIMDGRVKTLHPKIFGGILADRNNKSHIEDLNDINAKPIDLVVVNFYPFSEEAASKKLKLKEAIEYIDIGGPSMLRASAKNYHSVVSLCDTTHYAEFIHNYKKKRGVISEQLRLKWATKVFEITSNYESSIYDYISPKRNFIPDYLSMPMKLSESLRYGENPHQVSGFYTQIDKQLPWVQIQGKQMSYNNYSDMDSALKIVNEFDNKCCVIIKHSNPCGFGIGQSIKESYSRAVSTDPVSYFGGVVGFNREVCGDTAKELIKSFLECIIAPNFSSEALEIFKSKSNLRIVKSNHSNGKISFNIRSVAGGFLYQQDDYFHNGDDKFTVVSEKKPSQLDWIALKLGWKIVRFVKSNGIILADSKQLLGVGAGQMSRIDSVKIAISKAGEGGLNLKGAILASDAFFPFHDSIELAAKYGISSIIQPGGSLNDKSVIKYANKANVSMVFTGERHFYH